MKKLLRLLFSRYAFSGIIIILEVLFIAYLVITMSELSVIFLLLTLAVSALTLISIINSDINPEYKVSWMAVVLLVPTLGALIYILLRRRTVSREDINLSKRITKDISLYKSDAKTRRELMSECRTAYGRALSIMSADEVAGLYRGRAKYYKSGEEMFSDMLIELKAAKKYIFLEYFIIDEGYMLDSLLDVISKRASEGVEVRLIYDDVGCAGRLPDDFDTRLHFYGIEVRRFGPFYPRFNSTHNNRDHRKLCIIDGKAAFTGGINIGDEYINRASPLGYWKDGGVALFGDAVCGFLMQFLYIWGITDRTLDSYEKYLAPESTKSKEGESDIHHAISTEDNPDVAPFGSENDGGYYLTFGGGPLSLYKSHAGKQAIIDLLSLAEEYVYITTPYLIIDFDLTEALISAARRGVDVRIVTPKTADKKIVKVMTKSSYLYLIKSGVRIFEYQDGFIHQKLILVDGRYTMIGTINLDYRSLAHHLENAVWCYNSPIARDAREDIDNIIKSSLEINETDAHLTLPELFIKCALRLFAPLF